MTDLAYIGDRVKAMKRAAIEGPAVMSTLPSALPVGVFAKMSL